MFLKIICCVLFISSVELIDAFQRCSYVTLQNGRVKYFNRVRKVKFTCFKPYALIGNVKLDCVDGEWNGALPVCASRGCENIPSIHHGTVTYLNFGAAAKLLCDANFTLIGSSNIVVCEPSGRNSPPQWNYTEIPECQANSISQFETCDFEPDDAKQCKWISKSGFFNWTLTASNPEENPHLSADGCAGCIPHDHTLGRIHSGHFLYLEALFARTKWNVEKMNTKEASAKYMSPLFPPISGDEPHCLIFYLYANGSHPGIVEVLVNEESIWKSDGSIGTEWRKIKIPLLEQPTQFRITIEGKGELGKYSQTAIDDLKIAIGEECIESQVEEDSVTQTSTHAAETTTITTYSPVTITSTIQNSETDQTTEQTDQITYTTQSAEAIVVITDTTDTIPPPQKRLSNNIDSATDKQISTADRTEVPPLNAATRFNFDANRLISPTNHHRTNAQNNNDILTEFNTSKIGYTQIPSKGEILITENNLIYHDSDESKINNIIVEEDVPLNATLYHRTANESREHKSTTKESSTEQKKQDEKDDQTLNKDWESLVNSISKEIEEISNTTHLASISNDAVAESNDAKYKHDYEEKKGQYNVAEIANNLRHSGSRKINTRINGRTRLQTNENKNLEVKENSSNLSKGVVSTSTDTDTDSKMIWIISSLVVCITLLLITQGYRKYYSKNRKKDECSIRFLNKGAGGAGSPHKKDEMLVLDCMPKKTT